MNPLFQRSLENDFSEFEGLSITGSIPMRDALLNELLAGTLQDLAGKRAAPSPESPSGISPFIAGIARLVKKAEVRSKEGVIVFEFEVKR